MFSGEAVTVLVPTYTHDEGKNEVVTWGPVSGEDIGTAVGNVLFGRPSTERIDEVSRYHGAIVSYVLGFPKEFTGDLHGCMIRRERDGSMWRVVGDPRPFPQEICPTPWNMEVDVEAVNG